MPINRKLLIVDDEEGIREALMELAQDRLGVHCFQAASGKEALELIRKHSPDAILSDIRMPEMSGLELLLQLRQEGLDTPFVLLTAHADRENTVEALRLGATDFLEKPLDEKLIAEALAAALEMGVQLKKMERELEVFCGRLPQKDRGRMEEYRQAKRASLLLRIQHHLLRGKKAG